MNKTYCLVDCNNFFASCERVFNPKLKNKPVVVLTNNDGCIVARSNEVKKLGIPMGAPYFKYKNELINHGVAVFSSNYELYGDMSNRVMKTLFDFTPNIEIYSIDEAFLDFTGLYLSDFDDYGRKIRNTVTKNTGIPISVGIAKTKTLAKIATEIAKKDKILDGVLDISNVYPNVIDNYLKKIEVVDVWGIGRRNSMKLQIRDINTAYDLKNMNLKDARKLLTVTGQRTVMELNGISCIPIGEVPDPKKNIASTRSFGRPVTTFNELSESVASYCARACEKLRDQNSKAYTIMVFILTNRFSKYEPFYANSAVSTLYKASSYTPDITKAAISCLEKIYLDGKNYKKAGVILSNIVPEENFQMSVFERYDPKNNKEESNIMKAVDHLNHVYGNNTVVSLTEGIEKRWKMRRELLSQRFTTNWNELLTVQI
ncbi:MAG: Y-family DNA polymerase [bacterium]